MKLSPVFLYRQGLSDKGQNIYKTGAPYKYSANNKLNYGNQSDAFMRLALASTRDMKLESELRAMDLIV
jgi:hypothetical protein